MWLWIIIFSPFSERPVILEVKVVRSDTFKFCCEWFYTSLTVLAFYIEFGSSHVLFRKYRSCHIHSWDPYQPERTLQMRKYTKVHNKKVIVSVRENIVLDSFFWRSALPRSGPTAKRTIFSTSLFINFRIIKK